MKTILSALISLHLFSLCSAAGMLHLEITANQECLLKMENDLLAVNQFYPFITNRHVIHSNFTDSNGFFELSFALLKVNETVAEQVHRFRLDNNGKWAETEIGFEEGTRIHVRSSFNCAEGYFGAHCQHVSRKVAPIGSMSTETTTTTSTTIIATSSETAMEGNVNFERITILFLLAIIAILVAFILFNKFNCRRTTISKSNDVTLEDTQKTFISAGTPRYTSTPSGQDNVTMSFVSPPATPNTLV